MKKLIITVVMAMVLFVVTTNAISKPLEIWALCGGQSNMRDLNLKESFIPTLENAFPKDNIRTIKIAEGDTNITVWNPNSGYLYDALLKTTAKAMKEAKNGPDIIFFCFMQGESDAYEKIGHLYEKRLREVISNLRIDFDFPEMYVIIGRLSDMKHNSYPHWDKVKQAQMNVGINIYKDSDRKTKMHGLKEGSNPDELTYWIDTDSFNNPGNRLHYTDYSGLGLEFAYACISLIKNLPIEDVKEIYEAIIEEQPDNNNDHEEFDSLIEGGCFLQTIEKR